VITSPSSLTEKLEVIWSLGERSALDGVLSPEFVELIGDNLHISSFDFGLIKGPLADAFAEIGSPLVRR
jgi:hypothetical protein